MKILQLRFKNLNSLVGEWAIDFTAPEYISDGIFAISGPTGAGKSTIMDAICLALYGRTPRLGLISKTGNEIMSRHTGECFSEVVFETHKGQFRCAWSQRRAGKKSTGKLQDSNHEIADNQTGQIIESKLRAVAMAIEERTGMDFDRFTQSMLLAQGGFAAFLQANPDERSEILEQITGSQVYSEISKLAFDRKKDEKNKLELLKAETAGIVFLDQEQENQINLGLDERKNKSRELERQKAAIDASVLWLNGIEKLKDELVAINSEAVVHAVTLLNFENERLILQKSLKAAELEGAYASLSATRHLQKDELGILNAGQLDLPEKKRNMILAAQNHSEANNALAGVKQEAALEQALIITIRELDIRKTERLQNLARAKSGHKELLLSKIGKIQEKKRLQYRMSMAKANLEDIEQYFTANKNDGDLIMELTGIKVQLRTLKDLKENYLKSAIQLAEAEKKLKSADQLFKDQEKVCLDLSKDLTAESEKIQKVQLTIGLLLNGRMLREYRVDLDHLNKELSYQLKIADLESERSLLADNQPCPLCGSLHHPFAAGNIPVPTETEHKISQLKEFIEKVEKLEGEQSALNVTLKDAGSRLGAAELELLDRRKNKEASEEALSARTADKKTAFENTANLLNTLNGLSQKFGVSDIQDTDPEMISKVLEKRLSDWQEQQKKRVTLADQIDAMAGGIDNLNSLIKSDSESLKFRIAEIKAFRHELEGLETERTNLYGAKSPDVEEKRLAILISAAEKLERDADSLKNRLGQEIAGLKTRIDELIKSTSKRQTELDKAEEEFRNSLEIYEFNDEETFGRCGLSREKRDELTLRAKRLDDHQADIATRRKDREDRLILESAKNQTEEPKDDLIKKQEAFAESLASVMKEIGAMMQQLTDNEKARERFAQVTSRIETQKVEYARWESLSNLIGSADGKKYRNFAHGLTFEIMVAHANLQLMKLTDRYLLIRDKDQPLDLNVVDNYQSGEIRSTKNLSGGESFIVSLALALGLSKMASRRVRVDSLFLDEGFGTLDEDTLETALETLASLRQEGKLIGVISHVAALKERISTKIQVEKISGGKSILYGPGCSRIN